MNYGDARRSLESMRETALEILTFANRHNLLDLYTKASREDEVLRVAINALKMAEEQEKRIAESPL